MPAFRFCRRALVFVSLLAPMGVVAAAPAEAHRRSGSGRTATWTARTARYRPIGIDVASHQHPGGQSIDWRAVRHAGISFAFVKADEGAHAGRRRYTNPWFQPDWDGASAAGILVGPYHYARPRAPVETTAAGDAYAFVDTVGPSIRLAALAPVLDLEEHGDLGPRALAQWVRVWLATVEALSGRTPVVYTGRWFWNHRVGAAGELTRYPLWIANYSTSTGPLPELWPTWSFWQYTSKGQVPGIPARVDLNVSCGSPTELVNECRSSS